MLEKIKQKIMMIDAEKDFLDIVKLNLEDTGNYDVCPVWESMDFLPQFQRFCPHLLIIYMMIPRTDGWNVCRKLSKDPQGQKTPIIIFSSFLEDIDEIRALNLNVVDCLSKPIDKDELIEKLVKIFPA